MKRSSTVHLSIVSALASTVASCGPGQPALGYDPCEAATFSQPACEYAVGHQGYYYGGIWYPHVYAHPLFWYSQGYNSYVASGGRVRSIAPGAYSPSGTADPSGRAGVVRGGFGASGDAHAGASAGE